MISKETIKVLLVEDNPADARLVSELLKEAKGVKFHVDNVDRLSLAIETLSREPFDIVLLDLSLPDSAGLDTFTMIHRHFPQLPVIVSTGLRDEELAIKAVREGAQDYLVKGEAGSSLLARAIRYAIERRRLEDCLIQSEKMEAIGQMAGGIAHDFNNILMLIRGHARLLQEEIKEGSPLSINVEKILSSSEKASNLTRGLLALGKKQTITRIVVNLNDIVKSFEKFLLMLIGRDIELSLKLTGEELGIMADRTQIEQVLMNLAVNSKDAMPEGGSLIISTGLLESADGFMDSYGSCGPGRYAVISVMDTGQGIDEKVMDRIFEPFFTTKEEGKGTGLGLSTAYGIIKQHDGCIYCYSEPGKGTTFKIHLPIVETEGISEEIAPSEGRRKTLLLADDNEDIRTLFRDFLVSQGYGIIEAIDGEDAVNKFVKNKNILDLVILDAMMPKKNGREVYDEVKKIRPDIKALFISGLDTDALSDMGFLVEGTNFISKPYLPGDLLAKVKRMLDEAPANSSA